MDIIKDLFDNRFDEILIDIKSLGDVSRNCRTGNMIMPLDRYERRLSNNINISDGATGFIVCLHTKYDDQDLYETLCSLKKRLPKVRLARKPTPKKERMDVKEEHRETYDKLEKENEDILDTYHSAVSVLKNLGVDCHQLQQPKPQYLPDICWNWREYNCFQNCGVMIVCGKSTELFEFIMEKFRHQDVADRSDLTSYYPFDLVSETDF